MTTPVAGAHYPRSTGEFLSWFGTDDDCLDYLEWRIRLPGLRSCGRLAALGLEPHPLRRSRRTTLTRADGSWPDPVRCRHARRPSRST